MPSVKVKIVKWIDDDYPGFVRTQLKDVENNTHNFEDKVPIFTEEDLDAGSTLPADGMIRCEIIEDKNLTDSSAIRINTEKPDDVESVEGQYVFVVNSDQVNI